MKKIINCLFIFLFCSLSVFAQGITTANEFFKSVSSTYATFKDYTAKVDIELGKEKMSANLIYMAPNKMRIDFLQPAGQTIVYDGKKLVCYLPDTLSILTQESNSVNPATSEGLSLLRRYYSISYEKNSNVVPLDENSDEQVVKLILWRRTSSESFRYIKLAINPKTKLIRRMTAVTPGGVTYLFDFKDYEVNIGLTEQRFKYDIPSGANTYDNFLFSE